MANHQRAILNFYNSAIGDLTTYIRKFALSDVVPKKDRVVMHLAFRLIQSFFQVC